MKMISMKFYYSRARTLMALLCLSFVAYFIFSLFIE
jgi:hypothetical protein